MWNQSSLNHFNQNISPPYIFSHSGRGGGNIYKLNAVVCMSYSCHLLKKCMFFHGIGATYLLALISSDFFTHHCSWRFLELSFVTALVFYLHQTRINQKTHFLNVVLSSLSIIKFWRWSTSSRTGRISERDNRFYLKFALRFIRLSNTNRMQYLYCTAFL